MSTDSDLYALHIAEKISRFQKIIKRVPEESEVSFCVPLRLLF